MVNIEGYKEWAEEKEEEGKRIVDNAKSEEEVIRGIQLIEASLPYWNLFLKYASKSLVPTYERHVEEVKRFVEKKRKTLEGGIEGGEEEPKGGGFEIDDFYIHVSGLISKSTITWNDIGGLEEVKRVVRETIVIAGLKKPVSIEPWKGILFFGPPGTGKTLLASAAAGSLDATFFNVKVGDALSKYYGESSKIISSLYSIAREKEPAIIFLDEFDSIALRRSGEISEASRRTLSTLLAELEGFKSEGKSPFVLTIGATNTPWDLDFAVLSRFPKRIYVPLPDEQACKEIIRIHTKGLDIDDLDLDDIAMRCIENRYSGRDIRNLCDEAKLNMIRGENKDLEDLADLAFEELKERSLNVRPLKMGDFKGAFDKIKIPLSEEELKRYDDWMGTSC